ncbi:hypothetical protein FAVG1_07616 [Fusarium avenaceum]|nr:hypothetical protein FAVG1_07616 [Fusarium avenaceum]
MFQNEHLLSRAVLATRLRLLPQIGPFPDSMVRSKIEAIKNSRPLSLTKWEGSMPILGDLYRQRHEATQLIREYTTEAWDKLACDFRKAAHVRLRPIGYSFSEPVKLSPSEVYRLEKGFLQFEIHRHSLHYHHAKLLRTKLSSSMTLYNWNLFTESLTDKLRDWKLRAFQSIFRFVLHGYRPLIHEVEDQLRDTTEQSTQWQMDHVSRFRQRTVHQELLYAVHLSSLGYGLLQNLQKAHKAQLQHFILVSFSALCFHEESLASRTSTHEENARLCRSLEFLSGEAGSPNEPWTRARYFWDEERVDALMDALHEHC